jgi:hypothetical protein
VPWPPTEIRLKSFWLAVSLCAGFALSYPGSLLCGIHWLLLALMITFVISIPGVLKPTMAALPYRFHNACTRILARFGKEYLLCVCFCMMSIAPGRKIHSLESDSLVECRSHWYSREHLEGEEGDVEKTRIIVEVKPRSFVTNFTYWTIQSGHRWMVLLLPFLALLAIFEKEENTSRIPTNIYTLY